MEKFKKELKESIQIQNTKIKEQIDVAINDLTEKISQTLERNSTLNTPTHRKQDLLRAIQEEIKQKRRLRAQWQRTRDPAVKTALKKQISTVRELLQAYHQENWTTFLGTTATIHEGWKKVYAQNRQLLRQKHANHPLSDQTGKSHYDKGEKAEIFANAIENQFKTPNRKKPNPIDNTVKKRTLTYKNHAKTIFFSPIEVWNKIPKLPIKKASQTG